MARLLGVAAVLVVAAIAGFFVLRSDMDDRDASRSAHDLALAACQDADRFDGAVRRNEDIDTVNRWLNSARRQSLAAERKDSQYTGLTSGLEALRVAIDRNDAQAAAIGVEVVRTECRHARGQRPAAR